MTTKRKRKPRPTYRERPEKEIQDAIRIAFQPGSVLYDYANEVIAEPVEGQGEFMMGVAEGRRRLAGELVSVALSDPMEEGE